MGMLFYFQFELEDVDCVRKRIMLVMSSALEKTVEQLCAYTGREREEKGG